MSGIENGIKPVRITYLRCQRGKWKKIRIPSIFWSHVGDLILENSGRTSKRTCSYEAGGETEEREREGGRENLPKKKNLTNFKQFLESRSNLQKKEKK
jgi:hypothetical protein